MELADLVPIVTAAVAATGAWVTVRKYLHETRNDRRDRHAAEIAAAEQRERERVDRAASELRGLLDGLASTDERTQLMAFVALEYYFTEQNKEFHEQALSALVAVARAEYPAWCERWETEVGHDEHFATPPRLRNLSLAVERALRAIGDTPDGHRAIRPQSLQRVALPELNLADFERKDILRGADLTDARLQRCRLTGFDLSGCRLENTALQGADLRGCNFDGAMLVYTDLAGADLHGARGIDGATIESIKVQNLEVDEHVAVALQRNLPQDLWSHLKIS